MVWMLNILQKKSQKLLNKYLKSHNRVTFFNKFTGILGIVYEKKNNDNDITEEEIKKLLDERAQARMQKNWKRADEIRDELKLKNVLIEDTPKGTTYTFK